MSAHSFDRGWFSPTHWFAFGLCLVLTPGLAYAEAPLDLTRAAIVAPAGLTGPEAKAIALLADEVEKRAQVRWQRVSKRPGAACCAAETLPGARLPRHHAQPASRWSSMCPGGRRPGVS